MRIETTTGWLEGVERAVSQNCDDRPPDVTVDLLVIHGISLPPGEFGGPWISALFTNTLDCGVHPYFSHLRDLKVSSHLLVRRDGSLIQFVPFTQRAWHAGDSLFCGQPRCNDFSVGIELEGSDDIPYESSQYQTLVEVTASLMVAYPAITEDRIVGHSDIAPQRKTDPGPVFEWPRFRAALAAVRNEE